MSHLLRVTGTVVNVRSAPTTSASVLTQVRAGSLLEPRPVPAEAPWLPVWTAQGKPGWIHGAYVTENTPALGAQAAAADLPEPYKKARENWNDLREPRIGILLHYDASTGSDGGALSWFSDPACKVSYNTLVGDDGKAWQIAPEDKRAWHAGVCRSSDPERLRYRDANSAFYGVSWAGGGRSTDRCPPAALERIVRECVRLMRKEGWEPGEVWRIVGHRTEAWPRGRKEDPEGPKPSAPILSTAEVRNRVAVMLSK